MSVTEDLEKLLASMSIKDLKELDKLLEPELNKLWLPSPGPQSDAYNSDAEIILYGGSAGSGKSEVILGLALTKHKKSLVFRKAYTDIRGLSDRLLSIVGSRDGWNGSTNVYKTSDLTIEFGALGNPGSEEGFQGRDHSLIAFDEAAQIPEYKVTFLMGWLRSTDLKQKCQVIFASNPPLGGQGEWLLKWFSPWLDPLFPNPAKNGELRWAVNVNNDILWVDGPERVEIEGKSYKPMSRTFIPGKLVDNPYLNDTNYRASLENLPEPMRSKLLNGDFLAGREDHEMQVIPSEWITLANERWRKAEKKKRTMLSLAADVAYGGDSTVLSRFYADSFFEELIVMKDGEKKVIPKQIAMLMLEHRKDNADLSVDNSGGYGSGVISHLSTDNDIDCCSLIFSATANKLKTKDGRFGFANLRALMYWQLREALDPDFGDELKLPDDPRLFAELSCPRYQVRGTDILIESKAEIKKRVGSSPDRADAVVMAYHRRDASLRKSKKLKLDLENTFSGGSGSWMAR